MPFVLTAIMAAMLFFITKRLTDVEVVTKRMNIDRYLEMEGNYLWAVRGYEDIAKTHPIGAVMTKLYRSLPGVFDVEKLRPKLQAATTFFEINAILHAWS